MCMRLYIDQFSCIFSTFFPAKYICIYAISQFFSLFSVLDFTNKNVYSFLTTFAPCND